MTMLDTQLSRISKLLIDRDDVTAQEALTQRQSHTVVLVCGADVARSRTLQLAVLSAANLAVRCFPEAVRVALDDSVAASPFLPWPSFRTTFGQVLSRHVGSKMLTGPERVCNRERTVIFGDAIASEGSLRATFDGWIANVGPAYLVERLPEREYCSLSGILAASLAVCELFLSFADVTVEASRRNIGLSLWRPELDVRDPAALGVPTRCLPKDFWVLGLGHLGNAYLWSLASLPYRNPGEVTIFLNDFEHVGPENVDTGVLLSRDNIKQFKTRACSAWLEERGFATRIVERRFDSSFRCRQDEPQLAFCGFDSNPARRDLETADFRRVIESGLGGDVNNFDTIGVHTFPNPRSVEELWPDLSDEESAAQIAHRHRVIQESSAYAQLSDNPCGRFKLAEQSIAVPFVGTVAASLVVAEAIRLLHDGGPAYTDAKLRLATPGDRGMRSRHTYDVQDLTGMTYSDAVV